MINVAVAGAHGRVGKLIIEMMKTDPDLHLAAEVVRLNQNSTISAIQNSVNVFIDFSVASAIDEHLKYCLKNHCPMVIGVTGYTEGQKQAITNAAREIPIVYSPNMSIGVNLGYKFLELAAKTFGENADVAIVDIHHKYKKDSPSGTALQMAAVINEALGKESNPNITFSSLRLADAVAESTAIFAVEGERLEIKHRAENRNIFAKGALQAAKWLVKQKPGLYNMQDVLTLKQL